jgi:Tfp pilus assembly protein PilF
MKKSIELAPKNTGIWNAIGSTYSLWEHYEDAVQSFDKAIAANQKWIDPMNNKGASLIKLGRYEDAVAVYDKVIDIIVINLTNYT